MTDQIPKAIRSTQIFMVGSAILLCASCAPDQAPEFMPIPHASSSPEPTIAFLPHASNSLDEELTSTFPPTSTLTPMKEPSLTFTPTPIHPPKEEPTSTIQPESHRSPTSSATQTYPTATPAISWIGDLEGTWYRDNDLIFWHPAHWINVLRYDRKYQAYKCFYDPDKDIGMLFFEVFDEDPVRLLAEWAEEGFDVPELISFHPETIADGGDIVISGNKSTSLTSQANGYTAQATYLKLNQYDNVAGIIWYAPSEQWANSGEIFSEILGSVEFLRSYFSPLFLYTVIPESWPEPASHLDGEGIWFFTDDHRIGMLVEILPLEIPAQTLVDWTPELLADLGFTACSAPMQGDQMRASFSGQLVDSLIGRCQDSSGVKVTYKVAHKQEFDISGKKRVWEIVMYYPSEKAECANRVLSIIFEELRFVDD